MDSGYENIMDTTDSVWLFVGYATHVVMLLFQSSLAAFLVASGTHNALLPDRDSVWLRRLGATRIGAPGARVTGLVRIALGLGLLAPAAVGAPLAVSFVACFAAFGFLLTLERAVPGSERSRGRIVRLSAIAFAAAAAPFMLWEGKDNIVLSRDLLARASEWRNEEVDWQQAGDPKAPKVGDLAPDFELQDPEGVARVRLSDFRGHRPVALLFGSYT